MKNYIISNFLISYQFYEIWKCICYHVKKERQKKDGLYDEVKKILIIDFYVKIKYLELIKLPWNNSVSLFSKNLQISS